MVHLIPELTEPDDTPIVRLLPLYDNYFPGHQDRDLVLSDKYADRVFPGGGLIRAAVIAGGFPVAIRKLDRSRKTPTVFIEPFEKLDSGVECKLERELEDLGRFLETEREVNLQV